MFIVNVGEYTSPMDHWIQWDYENYTIYRYLENFLPLHPALLTTAAALSRFKRKPLISPAGPNQSRISSSFA